MITLDLVTPTRRLLEGALVESVQVPSVMGELKILEGHTDLLSLIAPGVLRFQHNGIEQKYALSYGFVEVKKNRVLLLAETCESASEIDKSRAAEAQKKARKALEGVLTEETFKKHELKLQRAIIRQSL